MFSISDRDLGTTHMVQHRIDSGNALPIRIQPRRTSPWRHDEIQRQITNLLHQGKVKESSSPLSFPVVLATKKDGSQRLYVDYRQLYAVTVKDAFPLPRVDDSLAALSGSRWFFNFGSCPRLLASGNGCGHSGEGSIRNFERPV